jgi:ADP-heptose:LPS heptosyltransferase
VYVTAAERRAAEQLLVNHRVRLDRPVVVVHPGSRGSALSWPAAKFNELLARIVSEGLGQVVVVGVPGEEALAQRVMRGLVDRVTNLVGATTLRELAGILSIGDVFVGNSSGPLHLAVAVSTPVVGLFSPIAVEGPVRWGPIGGNHHVLQPDLDDGDSRGATSIRDPACMERIKVEDVADAVRSVLRKTR